MIFRDHLNKFEARFGLSVRIRATDINAEAIQVAQAGIYPPNIAAQLPPRYLTDYFEPVEAGYRVRPVLREMISFLPHSLVCSPQTGPVDLISCRNLLIYLKPEIQKQALALFYSHLEPNGFLFLGGSESIGDAPDLFAVVEAKWRIFQRKTSSFLAATPSFSANALAPNDNIYTE
jgi:two-component system CheB/CheR fusion protein